MKWISLTERLHVFFITLKQITPERNPTQKALAQKGRVFRQPAMKMSALHIHTKSVGGLSSHLLTSVEFAGALYDQRQINLGG